MMLISRILEQHYNAASIEAEREKFNSFVAGLSASMRNARAKEAVALANPEEGEPWSWYNCATHWEAGTRPAAPPHTTAAPLKPGRKV